MTTTRKQAVDRAIDSGAYAARPAAAVDADATPADTVAISPTTEQAVDEICKKVQDSLNQKTFCSLLLKGPNKPKKPKSKSKRNKSMDPERLEKEQSALAEQKERLRGCLHQVRGRLIETKNNQDVLLQVTLKYHGATDLVQNWKVSEAARELESFLRHGRASEWGTWHPTGTDLGLRTAQIVTTQTQWDVSFQTNKWKNGAVKIQQTIEPHNRAKEVPVETEAPFWKALGLLSRTKKSKQRQCQKFVEIVQRLVHGVLLDGTATTTTGTDTATTTTTTNEHNSGQGAASKRGSIETVDMGCGRGYLTFALHHYLTNTFSDQFDIRTRGIDVRPKLVAEMNGVVESLSMDGLVFEEGTIESFLSASSSSSSLVGTDCGPNNEGSQVVETPSPPLPSLRLLIALHACDTATDDALWSAIRSNADVIVVAPCCHKEVRRQLDRYAKNAGTDHPYYDVLRHNIYRERTAETVTDSVRALLLEMAGYQTQVFEFIGGEHTSKNVMITAVRKRRKESASHETALVSEPSVDRPVVSASPAQQKRLETLTQWNGIRTQRLADWMGVPLVEDKPVKKGTGSRGGDSSSSNDMVPPPIPSPVVRKGTMPPL